MSNWATMVSVYQSQFNSVYSFFHRYQLVHTLNKNIHLYYILFTNVTPIDFLFVTQRFDDIDKFWFPQTGLVKWLLYVLMYGSIGGPPHRNDVVSGDSGKRRTGNGKHGNGCELKGVCSVGDQIAWLCSCYNQITSWHVSLSVQYGPLDLSFSRVSITEGDMRGFPEKLLYPSDEQKTIIEFYTCILKIQDCKLLNLNWGCACCYLLV